MRFTWVLCLVLGLAFLAAAGVCGVLAVRQATEISAYHHSRVCMAGAPLDEDCLQPVDGAVSAVVEVSGKSPEYALDVQTATGTLHTSFTSDSPMLGYAIDGDPVVVTVWRGIPVSVSADGRTEATATVPATAFAKYLGEWGQFAGAGVFLVLGGAAARRRRLAGPQPVTTSPAVTAGLLALGLGSAVVMVGGFLLAGKPSRLGPDLAVTGAALVVIAGLSGWLGISVRRRNGSRPAASAVRRQRLPKVARMRMARTAVPLRAGLHPARWIPVLGARAAWWSGPLLTVAVLFGVFFTAHDGPPARAFRHAPACAGQISPAACVGEFTATVNGVRTSSQSNASYADVSYVTGDGSINTWARFDGDGAALANVAETDQSERTPLTIKVWRGSIAGAQLGDTWRWAQGNPPGVAIPAVFLAVSFALLLLVTRLRLRSRARSRMQADRWRLIIDDLGQTAAAAGAIALLALGFWPGAILALATLAWLGLSIWRGWLILAPRP